PDLPHECGGVAPLERIEEIAVPQIEQELHAKLQQAQHDDDRDEAPRCPAGSATEKAAGNTKELAEHREENAPSRGPFHRGTTARAPSAGRPENGWREVVLM